MATSGSTGHPQLTAPLPTQSRASGAATGPLLSPRLHSSPILLHPLPPNSNLAQIGLAQSELELDRQTKDLIRQRQLEEALQDQQWEIQRAQAKEDIGHITSGKANDAKGKGRDGRDTKGFANPPQAYELYSAMDRHDIDFIMRVRDHAFGLLLQKNAGEFPIVYASRLGERHRDIVILLVGAMSR